MTRREGESSRRAGDVLAEIIDAARLREDTGGQMVFCVMLEGCFWTINELNLTNGTQWTPRRYEALHFGSKHQAQQVARCIGGSSHVVQFGPSEPSSGESK